MSRKRILNVFVISMTAYAVLLGLNMPMVDAFIWVFTGISVYVFLANLTTKINFLDVTAMAACISYLLMPLLSYNIFGEHNKMAAIWQTFMKTDKQEYFTLALPGTLALVLGLWFPRIIPIPLTDGDLINNVKSYLAKKKGVGILLVLIGLVAVPFVEWAPISLKAIFYFISQLTYVGVIYLLHSNLQLKSITIVFMICLMVAQSVITGMYGELVYWSIMGAIILLINNRSFTLMWKWVLLGLGIVFLFLIQSVKQDYREVVWRGAKRDNDPGLFFSLVVKRITDPASMFEPERIYKVVVRGNQGYLVARTMEYVPKHEPFARGETIVSSFASAAVPRFLWPDKPTVGGKENICRFLGDCGHYNYSYNIGQLGEAYVNFGTIGAWIYMFFYGYMLNTLFTIVRYLSLRRPSVLLWSPILFYPAMVVETDLLTFINTFIKGAMFCAFCFLIMRLIFKIKL
jgi:hypothetical protein